MSRSGKAQEADNALVQSFTAVRRALGLLGLLLPPALLLVVALTQAPAQPSISAYYYGAAGNILVGTLCAIAVFLWTYLGYDADDHPFPSDRLVSRLAAAAALLVAFVPVGTTTAATAQTCTFVECLVIGYTPLNPTYVHLAAAALFFAMLAVFCLVNFRRNDGTPISAEKHAKNQTFLTCGVVILLCLAALAWHGFENHVALSTAEARRDDSISVFVLESIAVWAFATAWLIKGEAYKVFRRP